MRLGVGDVYAPVVPKTCSRKFKHQVAETFAQLAPAAFDSIVNGDEVAQWINADGGLSMDVPCSAPWTPSSFGGNNVSTNGMPHSAQRDDLQRQQTRRIASHTDPSRASFTGSIAAVLHETLNLLWRPLDPDHPEDVFLRRSRHGHVARAGVDVSGDVGGAYDAYGVDDDMPIRAVYGSSMERGRGDGRGHHGGDTPEDALFAPLGSGLVK